MWLHVHADKLLTVETVRHAILQKHCDHAYVGYRASWQAFITANLRLKPFVTPQDAIQAAALVALSWV